MSQLPPPQDSDRYMSIETGPETETKVKGSRFLGQAFRVGSPAEAAESLGAVRRRYHDATHHCSAHRIGPPESQEERSDDDGEPSGTAGTPILGAILRGNTFDVLVVVTRYYGGTKLGTGGLARAYGDAAREAVAVARPRPVWRESELEVVVSYEDIGAVEAILARDGSRIRAVEREFAGEASFAITLLRSQVIALEGLLTEATSGRARISRRPRPG
jgi:uncharacterized YigZ family protein